MSEKNKLQEYCQKNKLQLPCYNSWSIGEQHNLQWFAKAMIEINGTNFDVTTTKAVNSKIGAEKQAAAMMFRLIKSDKGLTHFKKNRSTREPNTQVSPCSQKDRLNLDTRLTILPRSQNDMLNLDTRLSVLPCSRNRLNWEPSTQVLPCSRDRLNWEPSTQVLPCSRNRLNWEPSTQVLPCSQEDRLNLGVLPCSQKDRLNSQVLPCSQEDRLNSQVLPCSQEDRLNSQVLPCSQEDRLNSQVLQNNQSIINLLSINDIYLIDLENKPIFKNKNKINSLYIGFLNSIHHTLNKYKHWHKCDSDNITKELTESKNCNLLYLIEGGIPDLVDHFMTAFVHPITNFIQTHNMNVTIHIISGDHAGWCTRTCLKKTLKWRNLNINIINSASID